MKGTKRNKPLTNKELWDLEIKRIEKKAESNYKKFGYKLDRSFIPAKPDRVTKKALEDLRNDTTNEKIIGHSTYTDPVTGQTMSAYQKRQLRRKSSAKKGQRTKRTKQRQKMIKENKPYKQGKASSTMYYALKEYLSKYAHDNMVKFIHYSGRGSRFLEAILTKQVKANELLILLDLKREEEGDEVLFERLNDKADELNTIMGDFDRASTSDQVDACATTFATIINGQPLSKSEAEYLHDAYQYMEEYS